MPGTTDPPFWTALVDGPGRVVRVPGEAPLQVLLIEDDDADAFLVKELLAEAEAAVELTVAGSLADAVDRIPEAECILLDLGLPDASGLDALRRVLGAAGSAAVCVLTGQADGHVGIAAVAEGAQDYLVKGQVDGVLLARALQYAVERKRADENALRLREVEFRQAESARLERGLLPLPLMDTDAVQVYAFYRPGRLRGLLGGDFYDVVQTGPDRLHLVVGDVCGHGVEGAALGVELRVSWRALTLAGVPDDAVLAALEQVLASERRLDEIFATVATVRLDLADPRATVRLAGHPPPLLITAGTVAPVPAPTNRLLGVRMAPRPAHELPLDSADWALFLYTDGLIEGRSGDERLDVSGLVRLVEQALADGVPLPDLPAWLVSTAEELNGGPLADDVAVLLLAGGGRG